MSGSLQPRGLQHTRRLCPSLSPWVSSKSCPLSWWCHPTISPSVVPISSHLQSFPASGSFASGDQSIRVSASISVLPINTQDWSPLGFALLAVQGTLKSLLQLHSSKASILQHSAFFKVQLPHPYLTTGKIIACFKGTHKNAITFLSFSYVLIYYNKVLGQRLSFSSLYPWSAAEYWIYDMSSFYSTVHLSKLYYATLQFPDSMLLSICSQVLQ